MPESFAVVSSDNEVDASGTERIIEKRRQFFQP